MSGTVRVSGEGSQWDDGLFHRRFLHQFRLYRYHRQRVGACDDFGQYLQWFNVNHKCRQLSGNRLLRGGRHPGQLRNHTHGGRFRRNHRNLHAHNLGQELMVTVPSRPWEASGIMMPERSQSREPLQHRAAVGPRSPLIFPQSNGLLLPTTAPACLLVLVFPQRKHPPLSPRPLLQSIPIRLTALKSLLTDNEETIVSAWNFTIPTDKYTVSETSPVYLSLYANSPADLASLSIWQLSDGQWSKYSAADLTPDGAFASFTATAAGSYAVTTTTTASTSSSSTGQ